MVMRWRSPLAREPRNKRPGRDFWSCHGKITSLPSSLFQPRPSLTHTHIELFVRVRAPSLFFVDKTWRELLFSAGWESNILHHFTSLESKQWVNKSPEMGQRGGKSRKCTRRLISGDARMPTTLLSVVADCEFISLCSEGLWCECIYVCVRQFFARRGEMDPLPERRWRDNSPNCFHMVVFCMCVDALCLFLFAGAPNDAKKASCWFMSCLRKSTHTLGVYFAFLMYKHLCGKKSETGDKKAMILCRPVFFIVH